MKPLFAKRSVELDFVHQVMDEQKYDKKAFTPKPDFVYYEYHGGVKPLTSLYDIRPFMVFGIKVVNGSIVSVHLPQYRKVLRISVKVANKVLQRSKKYISKFFTEV